MNQLKKLNKISNLSYFNTTTLRSIYPQLSQNSLYSNIKRWIKRGELIPIKKGMYVTKEYVDKTNNISSYKEFLANKIKYPSYLSLEYILQKYSILSESVYAYTSVTLKKKKEYENDFGRYIYRSITPDLFLGFEVKEVGEYIIKEATKAKALFDYLYLKFYRTKNINEQTLLELRFNLDEFTKQDLREFDKYCELTGQKKYKNLTYLITKTYDL